MNNKGTAVFVYFMIGVLFFLVGMALAPALTTTTSEAGDQLNCTTIENSDSNKPVCVQMDVFPTLYVGVLFGFGGVILGRMFL